jgi:hypothetical protein
VPTSWELAGEINPQETPMIMPSISIEMWYGVPGRQDTPVRVGDGDEKLMSLPRQ